MNPGLPFVFLFILFLWSFHQQWPKKLMLPVVLLTIGCCGAKQQGSNTLWGSPCMVRPNQVCHQLGMPPTLMLVLFAGKVYCTLCAVYLMPSSSALTQHCLGRLDKMEVGWTILTRERPKGLQAVQMHLQDPKPQACSPTSSSISPSNHGNLPQSPRPKSRRMAHCRGGN